MDDTTIYEFGSSATCGDEVAGLITQILLDPNGLVVTGLVIEPKHRIGLGRQVPLDLVTVGDSGAVSLHCDLAGFEALPLAEAVDFVATGDDFRGEGLVKAEVSDTLPAGNVAIVEGAPVTASDGDVGALRGAVVGPGGRLGYVLLKEGRRLRHKEVAIPAASVAGVGDSVRISLSIEQIEELPAFKG